ncbi:MAG: protein sip-5 [Stenotrophomonas nitritireducens]|uniref:protein sip-5 n=1 Tax=Stenotrophomonas nitritireducens TaxID=83617 RepID=UPI001AC0FCE4|nr:protein sip-5 [Stenotrophomonas nitritireducens]MBN8791614.1 protein sip-5 [Stenotrophomonas nitritireducens]MBN8795552.1 protein sip-5 [Stenotrophomonas nitritireducens]
MNFDALQRRVRRAEAVVQVRMDETVQQWDTLETTWRRSWTPGRIVIAGLAGGFVAGRLEPGSAFSGARWLQMIGSVSGLVASAQASIASLQEAGLAAAAGMAASHAATDEGQAVSAPPEPAAGPPPQAAAAATELSES